MALWYCREVVAGHVPSCKWEKLACQRFLAMHGEAKSGAAPYTWSDADVADVCSMTELLPHVKAFEGNLVLEPVQMWWLAAIFGFREKDTGLRWVRAASIWVPRKNTKTTLSCGTVLFCTNFEGEPGAEAVISAGSEDQAGVPYGVIRKMLAKDDDLRSATGAHDTRDLCEFSKTGGSIKLAHSRAKNLDGLNPHVLLMEELHAQEDAVIGVLRTAMGSRRNPLQLAISTAGRDVNAPAFDDWRVCQAVLEGKMHALRLFVAMYAGDDQDKQNRFDKRVIEKLNPMYGVSLHESSIEQEIHEARQSEAKLNEFYRTRLNIWSRAAGNLLSIDKWDAAGDPRLNLDLMRGFPMYVGVDLASRSDLNAACFMVEAGECIYLTFRYWLGEKAERLNDDRFADSFLRWHREGHLTLTPGFHINYRTILRGIFDEIRGHNVIAFGLDDYQANIMATDVEEAGFNAYIVQKNAFNLTPGTEDLIARVSDEGMIQHDANPLSSWCAGNVVGYWDRNENVLPKKEKPDSRANIDGMDAAIVANTLRLWHKSGALLKAAVNKDKPNINPFLKIGLPGDT
jgi:phage terminase large subunit-like protein